MTAPIRLTRKLVLEVPHSIPDGAGGVVVTWVSRGTLWANVQARSGREDFIAGQPLPRVRYRILVRAAPVGSASRPQAEQRLRDGTRVFNILAVSEQDIAARYLEVLAEEGVGA